MELPTHEKVRATVRGSLFWLPLLMLIGGTVLALTMGAIDAAVGDTLRNAPFVLDTDKERASLVLQLIATSTITVVALVASIMVVAVQLASSQFSPRVLRRFLRDRVHQMSIGTVAGTFAYAMTALAGLPREATDVASLSTMVGMALAAASLLAILVFIDHTARSMRAGEVVREVADETRALIAKVYDDPVPSGWEAVDAPVPPDTEPQSVLARTDGWVQQIDLVDLARALPSGAIARIELPVGKFAIEGTPLASVWCEDELEESAHDDVTRAFELGSQREMIQDVAFGFRQLVDVGLRALSPGINDPGTAYEVINNLGAVLADLLRRDLGPPAIRDEEGRVILQPYARNHDEYVHIAFEQMRVVAAPHPAVAISMLHTLARVARVAIETGNGEHLALLRSEARFILDNVATENHIEEDLRRVRNAAAELGVEA